MRKAIQNLSVISLGLLLSACNGSSQPVSGARQGPEKSEVCAAPSVTSAASARPQTIPALQLWNPAEGAFHFSPASRIVVAGNDSAALKAVADVFANDLQAQNGTRPAVVSGAAADGDILLNRAQCDGRLGREGYGMRIGKQVEIQANEAAGVFYGTRTLLQLLAQGGDIPAGHALDWPRYPERGLMVDAGRKFFTADWIKRHLKDLAYLKLNYFHLHFSDSQGFRIESSTHPEIVSAEHLTKQEVREIVALAGDYQITVVPEIDMPGHMGAALGPHPELQLVDALGRASAERLDVTNPAAETFVRELIEEFMPLFPGPYWHTGADEVMAPYEYPLYPQLQTFARERYGSNANGKDAIHGFTNWVDDLVRSHGKTTRMWHDDLNGGSAVIVHPGIIVEWWTNFSPLSDPLPPGPQELIGRGYPIMNAGWWPTYYTTGAGFPGVPVAFPVPLPPRVDMKDVYETWDVYQFYGPLFLNGTVQFPGATVSPDEPANRGSKLHVWCDDPDAETQEQIADGIAPRLRVIAQKTWNSPLLAPSYAEFEQIMNAVGHSPGYSPS